MVPLHLGQQVELGTGHRRERISRCIGRLKDFAVYRSAKGFRGVSVGYYEEAFGCVGLIGSERIAQE
jgi:hypothetical protein